MDEKIRGRQRQTGVVAMSTNRKIMKTKSKKNKKKKK